MLFRSELYYTASSDEENIYIKAVNVRDTDVTAQVCVEAVKSISAQVTGLSGYDLDDINDFDNPEKISPKTKTLTADGNVFDYTFPPRSVTVFTIKK